VNPHTKEKEERINTPEGSPKKWGCPPQRPNSFVWDHTLVEKWLPGGYTSGIPRKPRKVLEISPPKKFGGFNPNSFLKKGPCNFNLHLKEGPKV